MVDFIDISLEKLSNFTANNLCNSLTSLPQPINDLIINFCRFAKAYAMCTLATCEIRTFHMIYNKIFMSKIIQVL